MKKRKIISKRVVTPEHGRRCIHIIQREAEDSYTRWQLPMSREKSEAIQLNEHLSKAEVEGILGEKLKCKNR